MFFYVVGDARVRIFGSSVCLFEWTAARWAQIQHKSSAGAAVDMWSLGVILFAMVSGFLPFEARNTAVLFKKIVHGNYTCPEYLSPCAYALAM